MPSSLTSHRFGRRDVLKGLAAIGVGAATGAAAHGYLYERHRIDVTRRDLRMAGLPDALSGLRIGFMTDLHRSSTVSHELIQRAASLLMAERPDLIVLGGDYVTWGGDYRAVGDRYFVESAADAVRGLSAPHGVFGVLGNHDDDREMPAAMAARGVQILKDARTRLTVQGEQLDLIGIRYWTTRQRDIATVARGAARASILLAHNPSRLKEAAALSLPLMLSGHTHGGQINWPGLGRLTLGKKARRWAAGLYPLDAGHLYVNTGVGFGWRFRFGVRPELAIFTLQPA